MKKIPCEVYTRCVGYFRPKNDCNPGKQEEINERKMISSEYITNLKLENS